MKKLFVIIILLLAVAGCIAYPREAAQSLADGFKLWFNRVLPSLMPVGIIAGVLSRTGISSFFGALLHRPVNALFGISGQAGYAFFVSIISGYPMGAITVAEQFSLGQITVRDAAVMQALCTNCGLLFAISTVASGLLNMPQYGTVLYLSHIMSAVVTALFISVPQSHSASEKVSVKHAYNAIDLSALSSKIGESFTAVTQSMLRVGVYIAVFALMTKLLECCGAMRVLARVLEPLLGQTASAVVSGALEITNGCGVLGSLSLGSRAIPLAASLITWSGFSIQMQSLPYLSSASITPFSFIKTKAVQSIIAYILCTAYLPSFAIGLAVSAVAVGIPILLRRFYFSFPSICSRATCRSSRQPPI